MAVGASACEKDSSGRGLSVTVEEGAAATDESLAELKGAVTMVPDGRTCRDSLGAGSWAANTGASVSAEIRREPWGGDREKR